MTTILVVDDETELIIILKNFLRRQGLSVVGVESGKAALKILEAKDSKIDLVILDMKMPGIKGITVIEKMKENNINLPVIVVTGSLNYSGFVERMLELGYSENDILFKPISLFSLLTLIYKKLGTK
ncbi:MAG: response regulator [Candidatus Omnitrophica bacterium]|nr:response regulator [Candidatus Omnitrophota bacterium]MBU1925926.1 response regulator [Candidatus Omnitrophota bacterium]